MKALLIILLLLSVSLFAEEKKEAELDTSFKFHSEIFFNYAYNKDSQGFNNENNRFYLGFNKKLNHMLSVRFTTDVGKSSSDTRYTAFLKYGYLNVQLNKENSLMMGVVYNPWHNYTSAFWGHRYVRNVYGSVLKYWEAADEGLMYTYDIGDLFKAHLSITNGTGYKVVGDDDKNKDLEVSIFSKPIKGLDVGLHGLYRININEDQPTHYRASAFLGYSMKFFKLGYQLLYMNTDGDYSMGHLGYLRIIPFEKSEFFSTFVMNDPNDSAEKDLTYRALIGVDYKMFKMFSLAVSYETYWVEDQDKEYIVWFSTNIKM
jgi:hypothetical protein